MKILIVDDSPDTRALVRRRLGAMINNAEITEYDPPSQGTPEADFAWSDYDVMFLDFDLGIDLNGLDWLERFGGREDFPPTVMLTSTGDVYVAVRAMKLGAVDYLSKGDASTDRLAAAAEGAAETRGEGEDTEKTAAMPVVDRAAFQEALTQQDVEAVSGEQLKLPPKFHRYVPGPYIGQGATSKVYLAQDREGGPTLALKVMEIGNLTADILLERFLLEAEIISHLESPHVVRIYEQGISDTYAFIAMEFLPRGDLKNRIQHGVRGIDANNYLLHIAQALEAIHGAGIVHRDIKPGNIMFRHDDSLVLADFGISKSLRDDQGLTTMGTILGTPYYMSPEQGEGHKVDARSDLYSAGIIYYEMLTGQLPFSASNAASMIYQHVHKPVPRLPEELAAYQGIVNGLLAKRPGERYQSAKALISDLRNLPGVG